MECSEKPIFHNYTGQELAQIRITPPDEAVRKLVGGGKVHGTERILRLQDGAEHWRGDDPCGYRNK